VAAVDDCGAISPMHPTIYQEILIKTPVNMLCPTVEEQMAARQIGKGRYQALAFLLCAFRICYGMMIKEIENEYLRSHDELSKAGSYPLTIAKAYKYLKDCKKNLKNLQRLLGQVDSGLSGMAF
jgi:hypothetical protein